MWLVWKKTPKQSAGELLSHYQRAFIIWPSTIDTEQTSCVPQTGLKGNMYTLKKTIEKHRNPFDKAHQTPRENASHHIKERRKKNRRKHLKPCENERHHSHVQNTSSLQYTSGEKHKKRTKKIIIYLVTPRGTQCDTLCIIASRFPLIFCYRVEREKVNFVLKWHLYHVHW